MKTDNSLDFENEKERQQFIDDTKPKPGHIYELDGQVVVNYKLRPKLHQVNNYDTLTDFLDAQNELKIWENSCIPVVKILGYEIGKTCDIEYIEGADSFDIRTYNAGEGDYDYKEIRICLLYTSPSPRD